jgi:CubicO group peptidase (beta-lactamase class C family)
MRNYPWLLLLAACGQAAPPAAPPPIPLIASVDSVAAAFMKDAGCRASRSGSFVPVTRISRRGYGVTRVGTDTAATDRTVYHMASISKPFVRHRRDAAG